MSVSGKWKFWRKKQDPRSSKKVDAILIVTIPLGGYTQKVFFWAVLSDEQMKEMDDNFSYQMASKWATRWGWFAPTSSLISNICSFSIHFCLGKISIFWLIFCSANGLNPSTSNLISSNTYYSCWTTAQHRSVWTRATNSSGQVAARSVRRRRALRWMLWLVHRNRCWRIQPQRMSKRSFEIKRNWLEPWN